MQSILIILYRRGSDMDLGVCDTSEQAMQVEVVREPAALLTLEVAWNKLHHDSVSGTFFTTPQWAQVWWRHFGTPDTLRLFVVRDEAGEMVGLAPMYLAQDEQGAAVLRYIGGTDVSDYLDTVVLAGWEAQVAQALVAVWGNECCREYRAVDLYGIPDASPMREAFVSAGQVNGLRVNSGPVEPCPAVALPASWEQYLEGLERRDRHELRRKLRKAGREALVSWYRERGEQPAALAEALEVFFELHARSHPEKAAFMTGPMRAFFEDLARTTAAAGWLALDVLLINGQAAATYLTFDYRGEVLLYNSGYDPACWPELSPGWVLLAYEIERAIALGRRRFDFLRGDEEYKYRFGGKSAPIHRVRLQLMDGCGER
jgi:CelD/BcsL family acetyltransferase involved in cellulose biosynthesis